MSSLLPRTANPATLLSRRFRFDQVPDLTGRVALVTGGSSGIGFHDALALARAGATVNIVSANEEKGKQAEAEMNKQLKEMTSRGSVTWHGLNLGNLKNVDTFAKKLSGELDRLDIIIANAGIPQAPYGLSEDGIERHFAVNDLSHHVLIIRLLPLVKKTAQSAPPASVRIVMQSSELHRAASGDTRFASKEEINQDVLDGTMLYGRTKLGNILFARELVKRKLAESDKPVLAMSVHPGTVETDAQGAWTESYGVFGKLLEIGSSFFGKSAAEGAEASLWAATSPDIYEGNWKDFQGNYYSEPDGKPHTESSQAQDQELANAYWNLSVKLIQEVTGEDLS